MGVSMNYIDAFRTAPSPYLDLCPHAWNKLAYSAMPTAFQIVELNQITYSQG